MSRQGDETGKTRGTEMYHGNVLLFSLVLGTRVHFTDILCTFISIL